MTLFEDKVGEAAPLVILKWTCLPLVEVVQDFTAEVLLALPLALTWVVEEVPQGPVLPLQQLPVQQQSERRLCGPEHGTSVNRIATEHRIIYCEAQLRMLTSGLVVADGPGHTWLKLLRVGPVCSCTAVQRGKVPRGRKRNLEKSFSFFCLYFFCSACLWSRPHPSGDATDSGSSAMLSGNQMGNKCTCLLTTSTTKRVFKDDVSL